MDSSWTVACRATPAALSTSSSTPRRWMPRLAPPGCGFSGGDRNRQVSERMIQPVRWEGDRLLLLDQTALPLRETDREYRRWEDVADAIRSLVVRGAPAIGVTAAFGVVLAARQSRAATFDDLLGDLEVAIKG